MMASKHPPVDEIVTFPEEGVEFRIDVEYPGERNLYIGVDGEQWSNAPIHDDSIGFEFFFSEDRHTVDTCLYDARRGILDLDSLQQTDLKSNEHLFSWDILVIQFDDLLDTEFAKAVQIIGLLFTLHKMGVLGKGTIERVIEFYESRTKSEQEALKEQTTIGDYLDDEP